MKTAPTLTLHSEMAADRIARRITARLGDGEALLPYDITERLRAGRERALSVRRRELRAAPVQAASATQAQVGTLTLGSGDEGDRKSTRLNSSHLVISYAVFCLKKKNKN